MWKRRVSPSPARTHRRPRVLETRRAGARSYCSSSNTAAAVPRTRCPRPMRTPPLERAGARLRIIAERLVRRCAHRSLPAPPATVSQGRACPGSGRSHVRGAKSSPGCVHVSYRVAEVVRRSRSPKKLRACPRKHARGERGLAQSGRPRRAKRPRGSNHGGKTVRSTPAYEGIRKGVAVVGPRSMKGASGRGSHLLFTRGWGKRSRPDFVTSSRKRRARSVLAKSRACEGG